MGQIIHIHMNFTTGEEISYEEGLELLALGKGFKTHCLEFFDTDVNKTHTVVCVRELGDGFEGINSRELMENTGVYTVKEIREAHNLRKMLVANKFIWQPIIYSLELEVKVQNV